MIDDSKLCKIQEEKFKIHCEIAILLDADPECDELPQKFAKVNQKLIRLKVTSKNWANGKKGDF